MRIDVGSPYNCVKIALRYALGNIKRPKLSNIVDNIITYRNDTEEVLFEFPSLNYEYANKIAMEDIPSFTQEEYGKFFYEYGRVLFANLIVALTHLDWYAFGEKARSELRFVGEYYDELLKLDAKLEEVLNAFMDTIQVKRDTTNPYFDFAYTAFEILKVKQNNAMSLESRDIKNTHIMVMAYTAMWFTITGYLLLFCQKADIDGLSRLTVESETDTLIKAIIDSQEDESKKINICSLIFAYFHVNRYYLITSGLTIEDPLLKLISIFSTHLMKLIKGEEDLAIIDSDLITDNSEDGVSIASFTERYDPLDDIGLFSRYGILRSDNTNIWGFGKEYISHYKEQNSVDAVSLYTLIEPALIKYIDKNATISSYLSSDNIDIEKSFLFLKNLFNGVDKERIGVACPGTILQLTIIGATYRTIEKSNGFSHLQKEKQLLVQVGIDIVDILILLLYQLWFLSGKFFIQPSRPNYVNNTAVSTLEFLREEVLIILEEYFEFIRFDKNTSPMFQEIIKHRLIHKDLISTEDIVNRYHPISDQNIFISECAKHETYTIVLSALCNNINTKITIPSLVQYAGKTQLDQSIIKALSEYVEGQSTAFTNITIIDAMIKAYPFIQKIITEKPENYMIAVYALLYETIEKLILKNSIGNYFDFNKVDNLTTSYKIETIVSELVRKPLHVNIDYQNAQQKLTAEDERYALW
jgi:hypothetical protein